MSYLKLPKTIQDHAVGFQSINQAIDNNDALQTHFDEKHSIGVGGNSPFGFPTKAIGRHDDILIARTVVSYVVDTTLTTPTLTPIMSGPILGPYQRMAAGSWVIYLSTPQLYAAVGIVNNLNGGYKVNVLPTSPALTGPSLVVTTWNVDSMAKEDFNFSLIIWTQLA